MLGFLKLEWWRNRYMKSVCRIHGHSWRIGFLALKAATRGRTPVWECESCHDKVLCMFPPDKYWEKACLREALKGKHGIYYRRIRKFSKDMGLNDDN